MAVLLVQGTGGGKSAVPQTVGIVDGGVTLIIENTLSLGADQEYRIIEASKSVGPMESFQLDSLKSKSDKDKVKQMLLSLPKDTEASLFIYASREILLVPPWPDVFNHLLEKHLLHLVCVDEVHQYVMFGATFHTQFSLLKNSLFQSLIDHNHQLNQGNIMPTILKMGDD